MVDEKLLKQLKDLEKLTGGRTSSELYDLKIARDLKNKTLGYEKNDLVKKYNLPIGLDKEILNFINHNKEISNFIKVNSTLLKLEENIELFFPKKIINQADINFFKELDKSIVCNRKLTDEELDYIDEYLERMYPESIFSKFVNIKDIKFPKFKLKENISTNSKKIISALEKTLILSTPAILTSEIFEVGEEYVGITNVVKIMSSLYSSYVALKKK